MTLTLKPLLLSAGIDPGATLAIRHAYVIEPENSGLRGLNADSTAEEILYYTSRQSSSTRSFPAAPPKTWLVFIPEGGDRARLWAVVTNKGELPREGETRAFDLEVSEAMADLRDRLVIGWKAARSWKINGTTAANYPVLEIANSRPIPFPGFDQLILSYEKLQAVMREHRYLAWRTALSSVMGVYLITDTRNGRHYVGKADGLENISQRWHAYATNGNGGNRELIGLDPATFRFSLLRVFDPSTPTHVIDAAEGHFKLALDSRSHGLNAN
ncbi:GIY-YIG nuclease family protein [Leifsonia sp. Root112D2]|uniref:GIY-YIG nuclease family protein n=1 Tax=Leifsonia sp. Root112D2 TaxID=1736426 RepID=UPI0006F5446E|nr:GIY-YIG nuclease family protein [Leifsonia sp. Root112D2]KQV08408.1 hypothetical protein ASC63_07125 [Leifsonia sp. Root112D2]